MESGDGEIVPASSQPPGSEKPSLRRSSRPSTSNLKKLSQPPGPTNCPDIQYNAGYSLDREKAIEKKANACEREHVKFEMKQGKNFVVEFSTAAYEVAKFVIRETLETNDTIQSEFCVKTEEVVDKTGAKVELRYKLYQKKKDGEPGCYSKLTINLYHTTSRLLSNGPRLEIMTDVVLEKLLQQLRKKYSDIEIMDQQIQESIQLLNSVNNKDSNHSLPLENAEKCVVPRSMSQPQICDDKTIKTCDEQYENVRTEDYVECPICDEGAMSDVMQCEDCQMWFHYECIGIDKNRVEKIPESSPFICINCNNQQLYEDFGDKVAEQKDTSHNKSHINEPNTESKTVTDILKNPSNHPKSKIEKSEIALSQKLLTGAINENKQSKTTKNIKSNMNSATLKKKPNSESIENEQKTLIIQLERQIREKNKTIDLLQKLNKPQNESSETEEPLRVNETCHPHNTSNTVKDSVNDTASSNIDNRMRQMEMNFCQNMNMITNCNMQMALQIQTLSNQLMMQSQQLLLQQQQQQFLNVNRIAGPQYIPAQVPNVLNHSYHGFNVD